MCSGRMGEVRKDVSYMDLESSLCEYRNGRFCMSDSIDVEEAFTIVEYLPVCDVGLLDFPNVRELEPQIGRAHV